MTTNNRLPGSLGPLSVLALLTFITFLMRFFSFFPSVMDHDESTYIVIADAVREGQVYLRDVTDTKPIGIFALFALFQTLFGKSIIIIRLMTALWVALTGWMLYLSHRQLIASSSGPAINAAPLATGIAYIVSVSIYTVLGVSPNTEHFFALFTATSLYLVVRHQGIGWFFLAGVLLGAGFIIKPVVLFDALAIGLCYLWYAVIEGKNWIHWFSRCALMAIGFLLPFSIVWIYYRHLGMEDTFIFYTFEVSQNYFVKPPWYDYLGFALGSLLRVFPVTIWFIYSSVHWRITGLRLPLLSWVWAASVMFIILLPGKLFPHYIIQLILPLSLLAGSFFDPRHTPGAMLAWMRNPRIGYPLMAIGILFNMFLQKRDYFDQTDYPKEIAAYLNTRLKPGDILYTANGPQIIYHLTGTKSPTPYVHPSLIWKDENNQALGIDRDEEWNKILEQNPRFIITKNRKSPASLMMSTVTSRYTEIKTFGKDLIVYEKI